jgi:ABC-type multidrug transport system ATPase subunit
MTAHRRKPISKLSGGQRKRVSIASELISRPGLLYLDEPTSGLDPVLERRLMILLRSLADEGRTVVAVTHATANIDMADKVAFLAPGGRLTFFGSPEDALEFFGVSSIAEIYDLLDESEGAAEDWEGRYRTSRFYDRYIRQPQQDIALEGTAARSPTDAGDTGPEIPVRSAASVITGPWRQFLILTHRYVTRSFSGPTS